MVAYERARRIRRHLAEVASDSQPLGDDPEVVAVSAFVAAMTSLDDYERRRVLAWANERWSE